MADENLLTAVEHVVVLMLENRSFDHMLGYLYADTNNVSPLTSQPFEGLTGHESNLDDAGTSVPVTALTASAPHLYFSPGADPGEGYAATNLQLYGTASPTDRSSPTNGGFVTNFASTLRGVDVHRSVLAGTVPADVMGMFTPELLPVLSGLARGYAVCDHWYSSAPTETFPNRAFASCATSQGRLDDTVATFDTQSIFGLLGAHGLDWSIFGYDNAPLTRLNFPDTKSAPESHFGLFTDFQTRAAAGTLGAYTFLEPSWGSSGNSQHPNYDVALGEQLLHDVYYALRDGPGWAATLLVVNYDEHGGCYDHVPPPSGATPPDGSAGEFGFDFTRFGVRVPAVLVSPRIAPGTVFRSTGPVPIDHTSTLKTLEVRWSLPSLTARDAAAPDVGDTLTLTTPRTDDPLLGVVVPTSVGPSPVAGAPSHIQEVQAQLVAGLPVDDAGGTSPSAPAALVTEKDYDDYIRARTRAWVLQRGSS
jgi:phospholipase C